jgi:endoplasmic reticulum resident protein 44
VCTGPIATRFHISKYPTLKVIRNGQSTKREYRGQRSAEAFLSFIQKQLADPIKEFTELKELKELDVSVHFHFIKLLAQMLGILQEM